MSDTSIQITAGSGTRLRVYDRTIAAQTVYEEVMQLGETQLPSYIVAGDSISAATTGDDVLQVMAGASLHVRVRRIRVEQNSSITTAAVSVWDVFRVTSAGTGGTAVTPQKFDSADSASGATAATGVPNATHGTAAATRHFTRAFFPVQTPNAAGLGPAPYWEWVAGANMKPLIIPAGVTNGLVIRNHNGRAGLTVAVEIEFVETSWL